MGQPHFSVLGFPVRIDTSALFIGLFIGMQLGRNAPMILGVFFFSILLHELGHALAFRRFGASSFITIHGMGGTTASFNAQRLTDRQHILVSLAGPLSQLILLGLPALAARYYFGPYDQLGFFLRNMVFINVGWALVNLLPIYPLDGGQVLHRLLRVRNVSDPWRISQIVTVAVGIPLAFVAYQLGYQIGAFLVGYMVLRGVMSPQPGGADNTITDAASRARTDHKNQTVKSANKDEVLREAYDCLLNGNSNRLASLSEQLNSGKHHAELVTLQAWQAALYGPLPGAAEATSQPDSMPPSKSVILHATNLALADVASGHTGTAAIDSGIGIVLQQSLDSPELLAAVVTLAKHGQLEAALATTADDEVAAIRDALVKGGLPQEQMAVSRILRLRREASAEG